MAMGGMEWLRVGRRVLLFLSAKRQQHSSKKNKQNNFPIIMIIYCKFVTKTQLYSILFIAFTIEQSFSTTHGIWKPS